LKGQMEGRKGRWKGERTVGRADGRVEGRKGRWKGGRADERVKG
jgi:hypothetical protein